MRVMPLGDSITGSPGCWRAVLRNRLQSAGHTVTVTTPSGDSSATCGAGFRVTHEWPGGFQGEIVLRNTGSSAINGWTLRWTFADSQRVSNLWGGTATQSGAEVSVASVSYTATIAPAGSVTLGFTATKGNTNPHPAAFTLNGSACSVT